MPELPEVETVRRGLAPVMEGARFVKVEANRPDLRRPFPKDFVKRLTGKTVTGLGRRAKYLLADLSSGDVLMMHLGMSGSFRGARARPRRVSHVLRRAGDFQRPAPLRPDAAGAARRACRAPAHARGRPRATRECVRRRHAGALLRRQ